MRTSIILVNYDSWDDLARCLVSIRKYTAGDYEIIVVDNNSPGAISDQAAAFLPHICLIVSPENLGFGGGNNLGASIAQGEYLVFLNPDTVVGPGWLEALLNGFVSRQHIGLVTPKILLADQPQQINACGNEIHLSGLTLCRGMGQPDSVYDQPAEVAAVSGAAFAIPKSLYDQLGGFDETFFLYMEDTDLSLRARLAGYVCLVVPESVVYHDYRLTFGPQKTYFQERNRYLLLLKNLRWWTLLFLLPALLLAECVTWGYVLLRDRENIGNKLRAYRWIVLNWRQILAGRERAQSLRRVSDRQLLSMTTFRLDFGQVQQGVVNRAAHMVFDPLFLISRWLAFVGVWR